MADADGLGRSAVEVPNTGRQARFTLLQPRSAQKARLTGGRVEGVARTAAFAALTCYAIGLVVVNTYLFRLGVSDFDLLKPRFILTGVLFVALVGMTPAALLLLGPFLVFLLRPERASPGEGSNERASPSEEPKSKVKPRRRATAWLDVALNLYGSLVLFGLTVLFMVYPYVILVTYLHEGLKRGGRIYLFTLGFSAAIIVFVLIARNFHKHFRAHGFSFNRFALVLLGFVVVISAGATTLNLFAQYVYPQIPEQFGGGEPRVVQLQVAKDAAADVQGLGIPMLKASRITRRWNFFSMVEISTW
jgi:hypothetical protein